MNRAALVIVVAWAWHGIGDYWLQTPRQAKEKGLPGWPGRRACLAHVATYTAALCVGLAALAAWTSTGYDPVRLCAGLTISAVSHYVVDRRAPLLKMARLFKDDDEWLLKFGGLERLDQTWHLFWLMIAGGIISG